MKTPKEAQNGKPLSIWVFLSMLLMFVIMLMGSFYLLGVSQNPGFLTLLGAIITGIGTAVASGLKFHNSYKNDLAMHNEKSAQNLLEVKNICDVKLGKAQENLLIKQLDFNQKTTDFLMDSFIKIEENLLSIKHDINITKKDLSTKISDINDDVTRLKNLINDNMNAKDNHDKWMVEINKDWDGCKKRIQMIDNKILFSAAGIIKENFLDFFETVISMNMVHCNDISSKESLVSKMYEKLDACNLSCDLQLQQLMKGGEEDMLVQFNESMKQPIFNFKMNLEKCFIDNTINNIFKNFYNYSSIFLNEMLNTLVKSYFKNKEKNKNG